MRSTRPRGWPPPFYAQSRDILRILYCFLIERIEFTSGSAVSPSAKLEMNVIGNHRHAVDAKHFLFCFVFRHVQKITMAHVALRDAEFVLKKHKKLLSREVQ